MQSLYFDTNDFRLIRRSIEKPFYKEKLRLRHYGFTDENAFLELKKKCNGIVFKRRIKTSVTGYNVDVMKNEQISKEISYFMRFYKNLSPKILITYDRTAFVGTGDLRITFDRNIAYRTNNLDFLKKSNETRITDFGKILMEIKTGGAIPLWLTAFLNREKIYKTSFSKCGEAYKKEIIKTKTEVKNVG